MRQILSALAIMIGTSAVADGHTPMQIDDPIVFKSFEKARAAGGYMTILNTGEENDLLIGIEIKNRMSMIHESREEDGVMRMLHVDAVEVPAGDTVEFKPGGFHVMIMGLQPGELPVGDQIEATLIFDRAGEVQVVFEVVDKAVLGSGEKLTN